MASHVVLRRSARTHKSVSYDEDDTPCTVRSLKRTVDEAFGNPPVEAAANLTVKDITTVIIKQEVTIKEEPVEDQALPVLERKLVKRNVKAELQSDSEGQEMQPKRKSQSKKAAPTSKSGAKKSRSKKADQNIPHRLVLVPGMVRPPGIFRHSNVTERR